MVAKGSMASPEVMVLCEVEVWEKYVPHTPSNETCDGCAWRLKACETGKGQTGLDHWDVDHLKFKEGAGNLKLRDLGRACALCFVWC